MIYIAYRVVVSRTKWHQLTYNSRFVWRIGIPLFFVTKIFMGMRFNEKALIQFQKYPETMNILLTKDFSEHVKKLSELRKN